MEIKHPNYYKNLRKLARLRNRDQAISLQASTEDAGRTPGTGLKQRDSQVVNQVKLSSQSQASSAKPQATSLQKISDKLQAPSSKPQA